MPSVAGVGVVPGVPGVLEFLGHLESLRELRCPFGDCAADELQQHAFGQGKGAKGGKA